LHAQIQDLDGTISSLTKENSNLQTTLSQAETRLNELYADQARWEEELAKRLQLTDNLRAQLREIEKEKRELTKRYNDQVW
jgi:predicted nuclease with TOPRIM domain